MKGLSFLFVAALLVTLTASAAPSQDRQPRSQPRRPNILLIVADDLGYADLGSFGGEIRTPHIDALVAHAVRFTHFYTAPTCSPTRAMLLSGKDNHEVGLGTMAEQILPQQRGKPGYEGYLTRDTATLAEVLEHAGYETMMAGKWHLGLDDAHSPRARGFEHSFALLQGAHNHFGDDQGPDYAAAHGGATYREDGRITAYPTGRFSGDYFTDRMIGYLERRDSDRPFFAYLAYTEPHWPMQAPAEDIARYRGRYDAGPAEIRNERIARMKAMGLLPTAFQPAPIEFADWKALAPEKRAIEARKMEIYAAMVDRLDQNVGRLVAALEAQGLLDNTLIVFMSDNGPDGMSLDRPINITDPGQPIHAAFDNSLDNLGRGNSFVSYGPEWAKVSAVPLRGLKASTTEGGIRTPAFIAGPGISRGRTSAAVTDVLDIFPTLLDLSGVSRAAAPGIEGMSWVPLLRQPDVSVRGDTSSLDWELFFQRAVRRGRWKAVYLPNVLKVLGGSAAQAHPDWELYDVVADPGETRNLAAAHPQELKTLVAQWEHYAKRVGVVSYDDPVLAQPIRP